MGLSLALFLFFCNSRLFALHIHRLVQSFSCVNLTDVNPYFFYYSCYDLWFIIGLLAGNEHILSF